MTDFKLEETYGVDDELDTDRLATVASAGLPIDLSAMTDLAECFVGFAVGPIGVYKGKTFEIGSRMFESLAELSEIVKQKHTDGESMILYYIADHDDGVVLRYVSV